MRSNGNYLLQLFFSAIISAGIAALYLFLFTVGYFPNVGVTLWVAAGTSALILGIFLLQLPSVCGHITFSNMSNDEKGCYNRNLYRFWMSSIIGAMATIGLGMVALGGFLSAAAKSTLVLTFFSAMFFAFELIQAGTYAWNKLK
jgi:hypothetical protein